MARPRALDYEEKRKAFHGPAAQLFADCGYDRTSMNMVADACYVSKALLYHYYDSKDALLFDILDTHLRELVTAVQLAPEPDEAPRAHLRRMVMALLEAYRDADAAHKVQINELPRLPAEQQSELKRLERTLVRLFADAIAEANPALQGRAELLKPVTMSLFGMLNWHYMWFRPNGPMTRADYAELATEIILEGTRGVG